METKNLERKLHDDREDLIGEHKIGDAGQLVIFFIFFIVWIVDCFIYQFSIIMFQNIPWGFTVPMAIIVFVIALYLAKASLKIIFDEVREKPEVINKGVYRYVRHPMYLAAILLYLSFLIFKFSLAAFIVWLVTFAFYHYIAWYEEKLLVEHLGADYEKYKQTVSMWIPTFK
jgi:protein-S-isoprenylcysteine O-methyltransferase Ste14